MQVASVLRNKVLECGFMLIVAQSSMGQELYKSGKDKVKVSDLSPAAQQQVFEVELERFEKLRQLSEQQLFENHLAVEMKKSGKSKEDTVKKILTIGEIKDKDMNEWYNQNKARVPYPFEQVKGEIKKFLESEKREVKRQELLKKLKKDQGFEFLLTKPVAPSVDIKVEGYASKGPKDAKVTIVEFADYQCPHCKAAAEPMKKVTDQLKNKVRLVFIDFPINPSGISKLVAQGAHCAKDKYWEYHELAFAKQATLDKNSPLGLAKELKLNEKDFQACLESKETVQFIENSKAEGERVGVSGTPYILINGKRYLGGHGEEELKKALVEAGA